MMNTLKSKEKSYIDGQWIDGLGPSFSSLNPSTQKVNWQGNACNTQDINKAIDTASDSFDQWKRSSLDQRMKILNQFKMALTNHADELASSIQQDMGKPLWEAKLEVSASINKIDISTDAYQKKIVELEDYLSTDPSIVNFKPIGPVVVFGPFNLPCHLPNGHIIPALLAGNTIVYKPSEFTPNVAELYTKCFTETDLPIGVFNLVHGSKDTGIALSNSKKIKGIFFTGSHQTGLAIHKTLAGRPDILLALEMGGNNPLIIHDVKNLEAAVYHTIQSAYITSGQRCVCARRLILSKGFNHDEFIDKLIKKINQIHVDNTEENNNPFMGPLVHQEAAKACLNYEKSLSNQKATILKSCLLNNSNPCLIGPSLIDVSSVSNIADEEVFGPILQMKKCSSLEESIEIANSTQYGLSAGILCDSKKDFKYFYQHSNAGIINWNRQITGASSKAPFGGTGASGNHRPSAYFAADYCSYPVSSIIDDKLSIPEKTPPGLS